MSPEILTMIQDCTKKKATMYTECMETEQGSTHLTVAKKIFSTRGKTSISNFLAKYQVIYMLNVRLTFRN